MAQRGRPPKPLELHRLQGTYRPDRHGPKLTVRPTEPEVILTLPPDDHGFVCPQCSGPLILELAIDRTWRPVHVAECDG
jgi:hypothetical protein